MHLGSHHLFLEPRAAWQLWDWRRVRRWEGKERGEMQGEGGEAGQLMPAPVTQKALSWFNGCEVLPPPGPRSCWCLIRTNIYSNTQQIHMHMHTRTHTHTHTHTPLGPSLAKLCHQPRAKMIQSSSAIAGDKLWGQRAFCCSTAQLIHSSSSMKAIKLSPGFNVKS